MQCLKSHFLLLFLLPFINAQCPTYEDNGECAKQCQCQIKGVDTCLNAEQFCNGVQDCESGFDEENCQDNCGEATLECREDEFKCLSDCSCLSNSVICNGERDCSDNSDEIVNDCHLGKVVYKVSYRIWTPFPDKDCQRLSKTVKDSQR